MYGILDHSKQSPVRFHFTKAASLATLWPEWYHAASKPTGCVPVCEWTLQHKSSSIRVVLFTNARVMVSRDVDRHMAFTGAWLRERRLSRSPRTMNVIETIIAEWTCLFTPMRFYCEQVRISQNINNQNDIRMSRKSIQSTKLIAARLPNTYDFCVILILLIIYVWTLTMSHSMSSPRNIQLGTYAFHTTM